MTVFQTPSRRRRATIALATAALVLAGCTASTGETTKVSDSATAATSEPASSATSPTVTPPTVAELRTVLPPADAAGADFTAVDVKASATDDSADSGDGDALASAMAEGCPATKKLMDTDSGDPSTYAGRLFNADDNRQIGVFLLVASDSRTGFTDRKSLDELVDATAKCPRITTTTDGIQYTVDLDASTSDAFGEFGATIGATIQLSGGQLTAPATLLMGVEIFRVGDVDVMVQTVSGLTASAAESKVDPSVTNQITTALDQRLQDLQAAH